MSISSSVGSYLSLPENNPLLEITAEKDEDNGGGPDLMQDDVMFAFFESSHTGETIKSEDKKAKKKKTDSRRSTNQGSQNYWHLCWQQKTKIS